MNIHDRVQKLLSQLSPDQQAFAHSITQMRMENKQLKEDLIKLKDNYDDLWKVLITILDACDDKELRINDEEFLRFKEEYRIEKGHDAEKHQIWLRLKVFTDK